MLGHVRVFSSMAAGCAFSLLLQGIPDAIIIDSAVKRLTSTSVTVGLHCYFYTKSLRL